MNTKDKYFIELYNINYKDKDILSVKKIIELHSLIEQHHPCPKCIQKYENDINIYYDKLLKNMYEKETECYITTMSNEEFINRVKHKRIIEKLLKLKKYNKQYEKSME